MLAGVISRRRWRLSGSSARDKIEAALAGYSLAQADMTMRMERANTEVEAGAEVVAGANAWTPSPLVSDIGGWGGVFPGCIE